MTWSTRRWPISVKPPLRTWPCCICRASDERILALFEHLAERWGFVTPEGIAVRLRLPHALIGQLVGSRRPTVTLALMELAAQGALEHRDDRTWLLTPTRPAVA